MRPAKIGQLSVIDNRPQPIDRLDSLSAGAPVIPTALRAWFCGHNSNLSVGDVCVGDGGGKGNDSVVIVAKSQVEAVSSCSSTTISADATTPSSMIIQGVRPLTHLASDSDNVGREDYSTDSQIKLDSRLSCLDLEIREKTNPHNDEIFQCEERCKTNDIGSTARSNLHGTSILNVDKSYPDKSNCTSINGNESREFLPSISSESNVPRREYNDSNKHESKLLVESNKQSFVSYRNSSFPRGYTSTNPRVSAHSRVSSKRFSCVEDCEIEMNLKESFHSFLYTNFSNGDSSSSSVETHQAKECHSVDNIDGQQFTLDTGASNQNRLSHQYLNSSVTGQNIPTGFLNSGDGFRYLHADTQLVTCNDCSLQPNVLFPAPPTKEISLNDQGFKFQEPNPHQTHFHHYYNKSLAFPPLTADRISPVKARNKHNYQGASKNVFISKDNSCQGGKPHQDLDMALFPKVSQHHCATQRTPVMLPHHYLHSTQQYHHQDHEQQHLLNHCQLRHQDRQYLQHHHYRHYSISSVSSLIQHFRCGGRWLHISPVSLLWTFLSVLVAGTCLLSFLTPYWTVHPDHVHSFGLFNLCIRDLRFSHPRPLCMNFGHQPYYLSTRIFIAATSSNTTDDEVALDYGSVDIARIPSGAWQAACLLFGVGVFVQIIGAVVSLVVLLLHEPWHHRVALINGYMQTVGGECPVYVSCTS